MYNPYKYGYYGAAVGAYAAILGFIVLLVIAWIVVNIIANWRIYAKAGQPGWAAIVPFYKNYISCKIFWGNGWLFLFPIACGLLNWVPLIGKLIAALAVVFGAMSAWKKSEAFGQGIGFAVGLFLLAPVFNMILGFGNYQYHGVPQDGTSYDQLTAFARAHKGKASGNIQYSTPAGQAPANNVQYTAPAAPAQAPVAPAQAPVAQPAPEVPAAQPVAAPEEQKPAHQ